MRLAPLAMVYTTAQRVDFRPPATPSRSPGGHPEPDSTHQTISGHYGGQALLGLQSQHF